jgi:hypothetical protein
MASVVIRPSSVLEGPSHLGIGVEPLSALATVQRCVDHLLEERAGPVLVVVEVLVEDVDRVEDGVEPDQGTLSTLAIGPLTEAAP